MLEEYTNATYSGQPLQKTTPVSQTIRQNVEPVQQNPAQTSFASPVTEQIPEVKPVQTSAQEPAKRGISIPDFLRH